MLILEQFNKLISLQQFFFIIEEVKETALEFLQGTAKVL